MKKVIFYSILVTLLGCQEEDANTISGRIVNKYTEEPVDGLSLSFGVATGSGFLGSSYERDKYAATTDASGYFAFESSDDDLSGTFYISNDYQVIYQDSMSSKATHLLDHSEHSNSYVTQGEIKTIYYLPSGVVEFFILKSTIDQLDFDSLMIKSKYKEQVISFVQDHDYGAISPDEQFFVEPSQNQKFEIYRVDNGTSTLYSEMNFFVYNYNLGGGLLGGITKQEIVKK